MVSAKPGADPTQRATEIDAQLETLSDDQVLISKHVAAARAGAQSA